jgi:hypothetical protein
VLLLDGGVALPGVQRPTHLGFTSFVTTGNIGGRTTANARCAAEFSNSHVCTEAEFRFSRSSVSLGAAGAWLDYGSSTPEDPFNSSYCGNFTSANAASSAVVALPTGYTASAACSSVLPIACCRLNTTPRHRGFTTFTSPGNLGGRTVANARCSMEFAGSHLCTEAEFRFARSSISLAAPAAWLDYGSSDPLDPFNSSYCGNFTSANAAASATTVNPQGYTSSVACSSTLPLACCD